MYILINFIRVSIGDLAVTEDFPLSLWVLSMLSLHPTSSAKKRIKKNFS
jgi:hypothetical protein